ncbi:RNA polymerase II elongation factor ELL [Salarias fasciatus]|uniref:RNA polymerase II elongation factor ELL n=1 Tax=Salarias fasciatus TaxID=181472 RepID=UPI001176E440|nr:RNA polymerase II elongation factor ELL [Salarias fasciatus]XP_029938902.1 RNA polymerase II elongation factor ELL [Salarias fasciatus]
MAALQEEQCYQLSCGRVKSGSNVSLLHVKLTDSALRAFEGLHGGKVQSSQLSIRFNGNQGIISLPRTENSSDPQTFTFYLSNVGRDNPQGSFDCIQQYTTSKGNVDLDCLGAIQHKITVCATDDSYQKARESMAQVEEETRSRSAIVIKPGVRHGAAKRVLVQRLRPAPPVISSHDSRKKGVIQHKPLRERLIHLLALKPYRKPELILRLQKDGLTPVDKDSLDSHLKQVANLNGKENTFTLKNFLYKEIQKDWPGYTEGDQQLLKRILFSKNPQNSSDPSPESLPKQQASSSQSRKRPSAEFIDPLVNKKPRISHLASKAATAPVNGQISSSNGRGRKAGDTLSGGSLSVSDGIVASGAQQLPLLDIPRPLEALSDVSNDSNCDSNKLAVSERLSQAPSLLPVSKVVTAPGECRPSHRRTDMEAPQDTGPSPLNNKPKKNSKKHKDKEKNKEREREKEQDMKSCNERVPKPSRANETSEPSLKSSSTPGTRPVWNGTCNSSLPSSSAEVADYLLKYTEVKTQEQRQMYKNDFNSEYSEYRRLHARIESITHHFSVLHNELKPLQQDTDKYKTIHNQIIEEYRKIKKTNPNYTQEKNRCEYLHKKLAHIKKLIAEFDQHHL